MHDVSLPPIASGLKDVALGLRAAARALKNGDAFDPDRLDRRDPELVAALLAGAGHDLTLEAPAETAERVLAFLDERQTEVLAPVVDVQR